MMTASGPVFFVHDALKGVIGPSDLLRIEGTTAFQLRGSFHAVDTPLFEVAGFGFHYGLYLRTEAAELVRNQDRITVQLTDLSTSIEDDNFLFVSVRWSTSFISLSVGGRSGSLINQRIDTIDTRRPTDFVKWARLQRLIPTTEYNTEEEFRNRVTEALLSIDEKVSEHKPLDMFWNFQYVGNKKVNPVPKREPEIQPAVSSYLSDMLLASGIEVQPEAHTGVGKMDFLFSAAVVGKGIRVMCVECKTAHSDDLIHGLTSQLPNYMAAKNAQYGAYCVFDFRGEWYDKPKCESLSFELQTAMSKHKTSSTNIRFHIVGVGKQPTASRKHAK